MKGEDVCAAHSLLVDGMLYIRAKQDETVADVQQISLGQTELTMKVSRIEESQQEIVRLLKKRRWTPAKIAAACAAIFGSGSTFPTLLTMLLTKVGK